MYIPDHLWILTVIFADVLPCHAAVIRTLHLGAPVVSKTTSKGKICIVLVIIFSRSSKDYPFAWDCIRSLTNFAAQMDNYFTSNTPHPHPLFLVQSWCLLGCCSCTHKEWYRLELQNGKEDHGSRKVFQNDQIWHRLLDESLDRVTQTATSDLSRQVISHIHLTTYLHLGSRVQQPLPKRRGLTTVLKTLPLCILGQHRYQGFLWTPSICIISFYNHLLRTFIFR